MAHKSVGNSHRPSPKPPEDIEKILEDIANARRKAVIAEATTPVYFSPELAKKIAQEMEHCNSTVGSSRTDKVR